MRMGLTRKKHTAVCVIIAAAAGALLLIMKLEPTVVMYLDSYTDTLINDSINQSVCEALDMYGGETLYSHDENSTALDSAKVNAIRAKINSELEEMLDVTETVEVPAAAAAGVYFLGSLGPKLPIHITPLAITELNFEDNFSEAGINFVRHSIYIRVKAEVNYAAFVLYRTKTVTAKIPVIEYITQGEVPQYYGVGADIATE